MSNTKIPDDLNHRGYKPQPSKPSPLDCKQAHKTL